MDTPDDVDGGTEDEAKQLEDAMLIAAAALMAGAVASGNIAGSTVDLQRKLNSLTADRKQDILGAMNKELHGMLESNVADQCERVDAPAAYTAGKTAKATAEADQAYKDKEPQADNIVRNMGTSCKSLYEREAYKASVSTRAGATTITEATENAVSNMADEGLTAYTYQKSDGTTIKVPVDVGVRRQVQDFAYNKMTDETLQIAAETHNDLIEVSAHGGARPSHAAWQGEVYSITGETRGYRLFWSACNYGNLVTGYGGYNCKHTMGLYREGMPRRWHKNPLAGTGYTNEEAYNLKQTQRRYENDIRHMKRKKGMLEAAGCSTHEITVKIRAKQASLRGLTADNPKILYRDRWREKASFKQKTTVRVKSNSVQESRKMSVKQDTTWPERGEAMTDEAYKELRSFAESKGVKLSGIKNSDADPRVVKRYVTAMNKAATRFPELFGTDKKPLTLRSVAMGNDDFAETPRGVKHIVNVNEESIRDMGALEREYAKYVDNRWFVQGTSIESIVYHELGHAYASYNHISPLRIARAIIGSKDEGIVSEYLYNNLSGYASRFRNGQEIISEVFSAWFGKTNNKFATAFMKDLMGMR
ncbi:MAG: phage minor capsid protein [Eggerthellaceae bacterium]|jgi:hypothetical protein|nr:phage minor capsid protein [Eggerthellaceae bacterium]MCH4220478.1 phage minor capsid protein [Eggerthellaceae bacterium]